MVKRCGEDPVAARIRYYIYGIVRKFSESSVRVPSSYELAKMFEIPRWVAQYELERLIAEGVLIGKKRIGTFTNPRSTYSMHIATDAMPLIAVSYGSGDHFTYSHEGAFSLAAAYQTLGKLDCSIHDLRVPGKTLDSMLRDIGSLSLDGLLWISPSMDFKKELFAELSKKGVKIYTCGFSPEPSVGAVEYEYQHAADDLLERCRRENRTDLMIVHGGRDAFLECFMNTASGKGLNIESILCDEGEERYCEEVLLRCQKKLPQLIYVTDRLTLRLFQSLQKAGFDLETACRFVSSREFSHSAFYRGWMVHYPYGKAAERAATLLFESLHKPERVARSESVQCTIEECVFAEPPAL
ncbi:MAG: hypothetical protein PHS41_06050 [Victivallaceae bacterium]|nr:hypothetical protein [Victivallaceae bacterium]